MHCLYAIAANFVLEATILGEQGHGDECVCVCTRGVIMFPIEML